MGSLLDYIKKNSNKISRQIKLDIIKGAASGINHLHHESIVHRDIAARNVLLQNIDSRMIAKITDFVWSLNNFNNIDYRILGIK